MRAGIIAEGKSDLAVITNILKGALGVDRSDIEYLVPELDYDETDLARMRPEQFSNWTIVKAKCTEGLLVQRWFKGIDDNRFIVIHIDTAERLETGFGVTQPKKEDTAYYTSLVREAVILKLKEWLGENFHEKTAFAVAVEETEAWLIPIYEDKASEETGFYPDPKKRFKETVHRTKIFSDKERMKIFQMDKLNEFKEWSKPLRKMKDLEKYCERNASLKQFCEELKKFKV